MISSLRKDKPAMPSDTMYPYLGESTNSEGTTIVLFTEPNCGIVVFDDNPFRVGESGINWAEKFFNRYTGEVVLKNLGG